MSATLENKWTDAQKAKLREDYPGYEPDLGLPVEPDRFNAQAIDDILLWVTKIGASDVNFMTGEPVNIEREGKFVNISLRSLTASDMEIMTNLFYKGGNGVAFIRQAGEIDESYSIRNEDIGTSYLFRVNVTACRARHGAAGIQITIRTVPGIPSTFEKLGIEQEIQDAFNPENGLVIVCGKTGSGKSTLLSAGFHTKLKAGKNTQKILTFEKPIESVYDDVYRAADMIVQHEIPTHVLTFAKAVRNSLRRAPSDIMVGESRDYETISAAIEAAETGHRLYTTLHANSVPEALYRMLNMFPYNERASKLFEIMETLRLIIAQKLVVGSNGRRVAVREFLVFDQWVRDRMRNAQTLKEAVSLLTGIVEERGQTMLKSASKLFAEGRITKEVFDTFEDANRNVTDDFDTDF